MIRATRQVQVYVGFQRRANNLLCGVRGEIKEGYEKTPALSAIRLLVYYCLNSKRWERERPPWADLGRYRKKLQIDLVAV